MTAAATTYRVCARCIMDTSAKDIVFDKQGVCNYCTQFLEKTEALRAQTAADRAVALDRFVQRVRASGAGRRYDCIVGVSGGVDSSWTLVKTIELGLRPLAVHMDNGWNSELAQNNIANLVRGLGVDLYTHVINWEEYRALMQSFFDADVVDVELLYDNAMMAVNYRQAARHGIRFILAGTNQVTEGMRYPPGWNWNKFDKKNIKGLANRRGVRLRTFPAIGTYGYVFNEFVRGIRWTSFLDLIAYNRFEALKVLERDYGYKPYPYKHYESVFTRFYQGYILPEKFGVDKRRLHFSMLVAIGHMDREEALRATEGLAYPSQAALDDDKQYFIKKMRWTCDDLAAYIRRPEKSHLLYGSERPTWDFLVGIHNRFFARNGRR
jgi:N-acetyl sugar amidotransferase